MIELNLTANTQEQEYIKDYLQKNVSETLADKINNGVKITKDNKTLVNKKDLDGFMNFAYNEASKLNTNKNQVLAISKDTVFGWAIHYFEEDSIEGKLYNEDGTEYKVEVKITKPAQVKAKTVKSEEKKQATLFDLIDNNIEEKTTDKNEDEILEEAIKDETIFEDTDNSIEDDSWTDKELDKELDEIDKELVEVNNQVVNTTTGEVIEPTTNKTSSIDKELAIMLYTLLEGNLEVK